MALLMQQLATLGELEQSTTLSHRRNYVLYFPVTGYYAVRQQDAYRGAAADLAHLLPTPEF
jgi:hypothetical protein